MPRRTTPRQKALFLLRKMLAPEGWSVVESDELFDPTINGTREVDVVARGSLNDVPLVVAFEVVDHTRRAELPWVDAMFTKHEHLETNKLVLVSWSGFPKGAHARALSRPDLSLMEPVQRGRRDPDTLALYADQASMTVETVRATVQFPDGGKGVRRLFADSVVYDGDRNEIGTLLDLAVRSLENPEFGRQILIDAHNHPAREELKHFEAGFSLTGPECPYLLEEELDELHPIENLVVLGSFGWSQTPISLRRAQFGDVMFAHGSFQMNGREAHLVVRTDEEGNPIPDVALDLRTTPREGR